MSEAVCLIRELVHVLQTQHNVDQAEINDLLGHIETWLRSQVRPKRSKPHLTVIQGGKA